LTDGYQLRANKLSEDIEDKHQLYVDSLHELECFKRLESRETKAIPRRLESLKVEVSGLHAQETQLQDRYARLLQERDRLISLLYPEDKEQAEAQEPQRKRQKISA